MRTPRLDLLSSLLALGVVPLPALYRDEARREDEREKTSRFAAAFAEHAATKQVLEAKAEQDRHEAAARHREVREQIKARRQQRRTGLIDHGLDEDGSPVVEPAEPAAKIRQRERRAGRRARRGW
jgi:hypothetical protein